MSLWDSVDLMFIDEVSVLSCQFLRQISCVLSVAKGNPSAFGGMNVIFAGDFAQLPPPADARLYGGIDGEKCSKSNVGQDIIFRKLLWFSVQTVVFFTQQHWQMGDNNSRFVNLLSRLREGRCNNRDNNLLHLHVLSLSDVKQHPSWRAVPIIVATNAVKDVLNECMAK
ncbi:ATP-dependent DNA helicase PIF1 [Termitomyces sp. J132]|nr:ATP-dependent DNA helicase PIF1 [Termitomyces sp. J132]